MHMCVGAYVRVFVCKQYMHAQEYIGVYEGGDGIITKYLGQVFGV